ncbi:hypothetical protein ASE63_12935 [Bosea sp. Root381]|jgi:hypothetical protein|uniref:hypothetical protein n=1 Tax=Bosea sp. Root381 TaxID=1736524 RepID=UPI0006F8728F|nr:hypothetical protein [Bosea sp. Root381]KRD95909.1 hypothetical protein ASE63_12935 [Bosea sp. Root381]
MHPANLQIEGLLALVSELTSQLVKAGVLTPEAVQEMLSRAETAITDDKQRRDQLGDSHRDAMLFPVRYLGRALAAADGQAQCVSAVTAAVGRSKDRQAPPPAQAP